MRKLFFFLISFVVFSLLSFPILAQPVSPQEQTITLKDGTVLKGHLVDVQNNFYTIQTNHMGQVSINVNDLKSITASPTLPALPQQQSPQLDGMLSSLLSGGQMPTSLQDNPLMSQLPQMQTELMSDPKFMEMVQDLMQDGTFMEMMTQNGDLMSTLTSMDPTQAHNNPLIQKMMDNPKMMDIINYIAEKMMAGQFQK